VNNIVEILQKLHQKRLLLWREME